MTVSIALFTADLRVTDNPVLHAATSAADEVVPLFVVDDGVKAAGFDAPNRRAFLADSLVALDAALRARGGRLVVREGDVVAETCALAAEYGAAEVRIAAGVSGYAQRREERLRTELEAAGVALYVHDVSVTALAPGEVTPSGGRDHFAVFTPYFRRWKAAGRRNVLRAPRTVPVPKGIGSAKLPRRSAVAGTSPGLEAGGEEEARKRLVAWERGGLRAYADRHDDMAGDGTSRLSPHLHFGTVSAVEVVHRAAKRDDAGAEAFVRQLAWRDFHHQVLAARPDASREDYRTHHDRWRHDAREFAAWQEGRTGYPIVDAGMRQLRHEGWMHNRARLLTASFLTKTLYMDWRAGAAHFLSLLVDGDIANNQLNWQWAAGTGTDTRPNRVLNPLSQAKRYDPDGAYVRRWIPELADDGGGTGKGGRGGKEGKGSKDGKGSRTGTGGYPEPIVDLADGLARFRNARGLD